jgi:mycofactocin system FadH/OYE family oxidoreductase 2
MTTQFKYLFSPIKVGRMTLPNRIICTGHNTGMDENDLPSERLVRYYEERAKAGVALMITGSNSVHSTGYSSSGVCTCNLNEDVIPWYRKVAEAAHRHGAKMLVQLIHHGRMGTSLRFERPHWVASVVEMENRVEPAHRMDVDEISEIVQAFGEAAKRVKQSGLDGVEVLASGGLIGQFMSPLSNRRTDRYGGNLDNRLRFAFEVIDTVRASIGEDSLFGMRIFGDELVDGGLNQDDMKVIASRLAETGRIDYLSVVGGSEINLVGGGMIVPPMYLPLGFSVYLAAGLKEVVDIPILCTGRINDPIQAEKILADGYADMVGMVRALICDPELLKKAREGRLDDIRKCVACNEGCWGRRKRGTFITCVQNPITGREKEWSSIARASARKRVMVVGGGPAGLEAARVCALRGHEVTLYEQREELGGQILIAAKAPLREEYGDIARYLAQQVKKVGVRVELNTTLTAEGVRAESPDVVIVATGSTPFVPEILGVDGENVVNVWDVLEERLDVGHRVVVLDGDKGQQGCSTAEFLADKGKEVEILSRSLFVGADIDTMTWPFLYQRLIEKGIVLSPHTWVKRISDGKVLVYDLLTYAEREREVDTVVLALGGKANDDLYQSLRRQVKELYAIGDCVAPRTVEKAIFEGHQVARAI